MIEKTQEFYDKITEGDNFFRLNIELINIMIMKMGFSFAEASEVSRIVLKEKFNIIKDSSSAKKSSFVTDCE